jgi:hypothetical protein
VQQGTSVETAAALAAGDRLPRLELAAYWTFKKVVKRVGGDAWVQFRKAYFARRAARWRLRFYLDGFQKESPGRNRIDVAMSAAVINTTKVRIGEVSFSPR